MKHKANATAKIGHAKFESPPPHQENPQPARVFRFIDNYGDKMGTKKNIMYRGPKLHVTGKKWFVEYYYRSPQNKWQRFKVYEDINRIKTLEYATELFNAIKIGLDEGYSPFKKKQILLKNQDFQRKEWTANQAILHFKTKWKERGIEDSSIDKYNRTADRFLRWCKSISIEHDPVELITHKHIEAYLQKVKQEGGWTNRGYNNEKRFLSTMFNFFVRDCNCPRNPVKGISNQKTASKKHKYYDEKTFNKVKDAMIKFDPYLLFAAQVVYYLCVRSEKELSLLKVGNIIPERKQVLINAEDSKTDADRYVPMPDEMLKIFKERKVFDYPRGYYLFSVPHKNKFVLDGQPGPEHFARGFFSKRFAKIRKIAGLTSDYTMFSFRHTRCVHLKNDGAKDQEIQNLMGHTDFATTAKYLRDLGLMVDPDAINQRTRKF